ncbi:PREDICTED: sarcoplasmic reticulum histidine-rich calcium-binding protein-like [Populus euphratica]|uniref:Sarcoplasmic reticulum histidine-rich calcium-binding protein-like n=1 Tax=Populus euphratica TaxID=75702 RepID=A0AAJ6U3K4_POPEU|nr:PREDICTED: sarcoplasmic reticulum histidine-rich calcium-binding protein-like [Populus euphratica]
MFVKLTVTVLFFLCAVAYSRTPSDLPDGDFTLPELPRSDPKATPVLFLPSQKPETSEPATEIKYPADVEIEEQKEPGSSSTEVNTESIEKKVPLTVVTFRPTNLHFLPRRPLLPVRHRHGCRHGHNMMKPRFYGNDMVVSGEKDDGFELGDHQATRGVVRQIPARWTRFHHGGQKFSFYDDVANGEEREWGHKMHHKHHHDHEEHEHDHEEHEHEHDHEEHEHEHDDEGHGHDHEEHEHEEHGRGRGRGRDHEEHEHEERGRGRGHEHEGHGHEHEHEEHGYGHEHEEHGHEWGLSEGIRKFLKHNF